MRPAPALTANRPMGQYVIHWVPCTQRVTEGVRMQQQSQATTRRDHNTRRPSHNPGQGCSCTNVMAHQIASALPLSISVSPPPSERHSQALQVRTKDSYAW